MASIPCFDASSTPSSGPAKVNRDLISLLLAGRDKEAASSVFLLDEALVLIIIFREAGSEADGCCCKHREKGYEESTLVHKATVTQAGKPKYNCGLTLVARESRVIRIRRAVSVVSFVFGVALSSVLDSCSGGGNDAG